MCVQYLPNVFNFFCNFSFVTDRFYSRYYLRNGNFVRIDDANNGFVTHAIAQIQV